MPSRVHHSVAGLICGDAPKRNDAAGSSGAVASGFDHAPCSGGTGCCGASLFHTLPLPHVVKYRLSFASRLGRSTLWIVVVNGGARRQAGSTRLPTPVLVHCRCGVAAALWPSHGPVPRAELHTTELPPPDSHRSSRWTQCALPRCSGQARTARVCTTPARSRLTVVFPRLQPASAVCTVLSVPPIAPVPPLRTLAAPSAPTATTVRPSADDTVCCCCCCCCCCWALAAAAQQQDAAAAASRRSSRSIGPCVSARGPQSSTDHPYRRA